MGLIVLLSVTAASWFLLGPVWATVAFLCFAVVRIALHTRALEVENEELRCQLSRVSGGPLVVGDEQPADVVDAPPQSGTRAVARISRKASGA